MSVVKDAMNAWGRNFLRDQGHEISDEAEVEFVEDTVYDGYCETCYFDYQVINVSAEGRAAQWAGSMYDLLAEMNREES